MADKKRILILSADAGFGHRSAARALAAALAEVHGQDCECEIVNPLDHDKTPGWLHSVQSDYDRIARDMPELYKFGFDISDTSVARRVADNGLRVILYRTIKDIVTGFKPDAIISTYPLYTAPLNALFTLTKLFIPTICVVTDITSIHQMWFSSDADLTVVPTGIVKDLAIGAGLDPRQVEVIGIPVHPRISAESRDKASLKAELGWDPDRITALAVGSKRVSNLVPALNALNHSGFPIQLAVVAGGDDKLYSELSAIEWHMPAKVYNYVTNMPAMMKAADCMVTKAGGLIISESLASGLPTLIIEAIPGQETGNAEYVVKGGGGDMGTEPVQALEVLCHWLANDGKLLRERAAAAAMLGKPRAAYEIVERAWQFALRGPARKEGAQLPGLQKLRELFGRYDLPLDE